MPSEHAEALALAQRYIDERAYVVPAEASATSVRVVSFRSGEIHTDGTQAMRLLARSVVALAAERDAAVQRIAALEAALRELPSKAIHIVTLVREPYGELYREPALLVSTLRAAIDAALAPAAKGGA